MPTTKKFHSPATPGQKKLLRLHISLPLLPLTTPGNLPKPPELLELKYKVEKGVQSAAELYRKQKQATELWIMEQDRLGLDVLVDGEMMRGDMITFFAKKIDGFSTGGLVRTVGNLYFKRPLLTGKLAWKESLTLNEWKIAQRLTHKPLKANITGPYSLMDCSFNEYYSSRESVCGELIPIIRKEIESLVENGAKIIQIDEPSLSARPDEIAMVADSIKELTKNLNCYFILHHSFGDGSLPWSQLIRFAVDNLSLAMATTDFPSLPILKKQPTDKDITLGLVDSHNNHVETSRELNQRIKKSLTSLKAQNVWISPDGGLKMRSADVCVDKLKSMIQVTKKFRSALKGARRK